MDRLMYQQRIKEFGDDILELGLHNNIIHNVIYAYCHGEISTKEEALTQMVLLLDKQNGMQFQLLMDLAKHGYPNIVLDI